MGTIIVTILYTGINIAVAVYILREIILTIKQTDSNKNKKKIKGSPFGDTNNETIIKVQHTSLNRRLLILAAILPLMILSTIYFTILEPFYEILNAYSEFSGFDISLIYLVALFAGITFARIFLKPNSKNNEFYDTNNKMILEERIDNVGIFYLSFTFCVILFSYLDFDLKVNIIKGTTTFFLIGNLFYFVFRQNIKRPKSFFNSFSKKKDNLNIDNNKNLNDEYDI